MIADAENIVENWKNVAVAVGALFGNDDFLIPAGIYAFFTFFNGGLFARFMGRRNSAEPQTTET